MVIHDHLVVVVIGEQIIPKVSIVVEGVVEHKVSLRGVSLNHLSHFSVEVF